MIPLLFSSLRTLERRFGSKIGYSEDILMESNFLQVYFIEISILKQDRKTDDMVLTTYFILDWIVSSLCG